MIDLKLTSREALVLRTFLPKQNVYDFGEAVYHKMSLLTFDIYDNESVLIIDDELKGVLGSLVKKGLLNVEVEDYYNKNAPRFIWLGNMFRDDEDLLNEVIDLAKKTN